MHIRKHILLLFAIGTSPATFSAEQKDRPGEWRHGVVGEAFVHEGADFPSCHAATLAETPTGLVCAFFGGTKERHPDVEIYLSRLANGTWTAPVSVANGSTEDGGRFPTWNPVLYQAPNGGDLLLFYKVGPKPSEWWGMLKRSADGGKTWSPAQKLPNGYLGPVKNKPVLLANGNLICPSSTEGNGWSIHLETTPDFGSTWRRTGPIDRGTDDLDAIQPSLLDHGNGRLQLLARSRNRALVESWSSDHGETWTPLRKTDLPNNNSGTDAVTMGNGTHVLVYNHVLPPADHPKGARTPLNVAVSEDGENWEAVLVLEDSPIGQYSYPAVIQTRDGMLHIAYTWRREKIKHVTVDPAKWKKRKMKNGTWPGAQGHALPAMETEAAFAQNSDNRYRKPLKEVLETIQTKYGIAISYREEQVRGRWLDYADWRFRPDVDETLRQVLAPLDLKAEKEEDRKYKLKEYEYYRWEVKDGWAYLDRLAGQYRDRASWEKRKAAIRPELYAALRLSPLPEAPASAPIISEKRTFDGYTVENFALEILPGVYINGSMYKPARPARQMPLVLNPDGHWPGHRYRPDAQIRCAMLAKMGAMAVSYDLFAWGESLLQFGPEDHRKSLSMTVQTLGAIRILDELLAHQPVDAARVGICGGSGGGSHAVLMAALDDRIALSIPVVSLSSHFFGGCPCESGMPIHASAGGTNNVELAAMAAPRPQLVVSDGKDWTARMPEHDFPYLRRMYGYYGKTENVENAHLPDDGHDFGYSKRKPVYDFLARHFGLDDRGIKQADGEYDESGCTVEEERALYAFGAKGERLPANAIKGYENLEKLLQN